MFTTSVLVHNTLTIYYYYIVVINNICISYKIEIRLIYILILQNYIYIWLLNVINILNYKTSRKNIRCLQLTNKVRK